MSQTLKQELKEALNLPEESFSNHCSDLYVLATPETVSWLKKNYAYYNNIIFSYGDVEGSVWYGKSFLDIPFASTESY